MIASPCRDLAIRRPPVAIGSAFAIDVFLVFTKKSLYTAACARVATVRERQGVDFRTKIVGLKDGGIASPRRDLAIRHPPVAIGSAFAIDIFLIRK